MEGGKSKPSFSSSSFLNKMSGLVELRKINIENKQHINYATIKLISNLDTLILAYELIKSKPGNVTPGLTAETLDGITLNILKEMSEQLASGKFKFSPVRRVMISKPGKSDKRPLSIGNPKEKIVHKAIQLVLESIFEPTFLDCSHGFRPNRGVNTAMKYIDSKFKNTT